MNDLETLHSRYATALFEHAKERNLQKNIRNEYGSLCNFFERYPDHKKIFISPYLTRKEKRVLLEQLNEKLKLNNSFLSFLKVLVEENRFAIIRGIFLKYKDLYAIDKGIIRINVFSTEDLPKKEINKLKLAMKKKLKKEIEIKNIVDNSLIGGLKIVIEDDIIDASLKGSLDNIRETITI